MGNPLLRQVDGIPGEDKRTGFTMSRPCDNCGTLLFWHHNFPYEVGVKIDYYEGCSGLVYDKFNKKLVYADVLRIKPDKVTPRHFCTNYDRVLKRLDEKVFDKGLTTLF